MPDWLMPEWLVWMSLSLEWLSLSTIADLGILGALVTLAWNVWSDRTQRRRELDREREQRQREREGLLRLLDIEIGFHHENELRDIQREPEREVWEDPFFPGLDTSAWEDVRGSLSQLLDARQFADFLRYYHNVQALNAVRKGPLSSEVVKRNLAVVLQPVLEQHNLVMRHIREHVPQETESAGSELPAQPAAPQADARHSTAERRLPEEEAFRDVERLLVVERQKTFRSAQMYAQPLKDFSKRDWRLVSHSYALEENGLGLLTYVLERVGEDAPASEKS
jgi:hypothetical protein